MLVSGLIKSPKLTASQNKLKNKSFPPPAGSENSGQQENTDNYSKEFPSLYNL